MRASLLATLGLSLLSASLLGACSSAPDAPPERFEVATNEVTYDAGGVDLKGFIARPAGPVEKRPGVLVVHEWWGHNDYARGRARQLAEKGYVALAVDMYGDGKVASHPNDASAFMAEVTGNRAVMESRFHAGLALLQSQNDVDAERLGAVGYCMGGAICLNMARLGADLDAVVSVHGLLDSDITAQPGDVKGEVLVLSGEDDPMAAEESVERFNAEMTGLGAKFEVTTYPGVVHAFSNPEATKFGEEFGLPLRYDAAADADSWARMLALFERAL